MYFLPPTLRYKEQLNGFEPKELLTPEEYEELRALCRQSQKAERAEQAQEEEQERPPGEEVPATPEGTDTVSSKLSSITLSSEAVLKFVKLKFHRVMFFSFLGSRRN